MIAMDDDVLFCVREDHEHPTKEATNTIVAIDLKTKEQFVLVGSGLKFNELRRGDRR